MKCDASEEFTTSTFLIPDWNSWLIRWNTRSEPERSTSIFTSGYSVRNNFATASATLTSTAVYQTTLPSLTAAAISAGVVSWAMADAAPPNARQSASAVRTAMPVMVILRCVSYRDSPDVYLL